MNVEMECGEYECRKVERQCRVVNRGSGEWRSEVK